MRAWANEGNAWFRVEFEFGSDLIEASDNLRNAIAKRALQTTGGKCANR